MKIVTNYFEDRREALFEVLGPQLLADVIGYHAHRASIHRVLKAGAGGDRQGRARPARAAGRASASAGSPSWTSSARGPRRRSRRSSPSGRRRRCCTPSTPSRRCRTTRPTRRGSPVPWLNIYDTRDFLSFLAEPLFRRSDGLASVVDLRVRSGKDFPKSHGGYWELAPVWDAIATAFTWRRIEPLTVREARRLGFEARKAPAATDEET